MDFTSTDVDSLADKLAAMDLTDGEWEALRTMAALSATALPGDDEVSGFGYEAVTLERGGVAFGSLSLKLGPPVGSYQALPELDANVRNVTMGGGSPTV